MSSRPKLCTTDRQRLFALHGGLCHICGEPIDGVRQRWEIEHVIPRGMIGAEADTDANMRPAHHRPCHAAKTVMDIDVIAQAKRRQAKHIGAYRSKSIIPGSRASSFKKRMDGRVERRPVDTAPTTL